MELGKETTAYKVEQITIQFEYKCDDSCPNKEVITQWAILNSTYYIEPPNLICATCKRLMERRTKS